MGHSPAEGLHCPDKCHVVTQGLVLDRGCTSRLLFSRMFFFPGCLGWQDRMSRWWVPMPLSRGIALLSCPSVSGVHTHSRHEWGSWPPVWIFSAWGHTSIPWSLELDMLFPASGPLQVLFTLLGILRSVATPHFCLNKSSPYVVG